MTRLLGHSVFTFLTFFVLLTTRVIAIPASPQPSLLSIPLTLSTGAFNSSQDLHGSVVSWFAHVEEKRAYIDFR